MTDAEFLATFPVSDISFDIAGIDALRIFRIIGDTAFEKQWAAYVSNYPFSQLRDAGAHVARARLSLLMGVSYIWNTVEVPRAE